MFSAELKRLRTEYGLTQAQLATRLGISASAVGMYEQGRREPDSELLARLARMFHVSTDTLLGFRQEPQAGQEQEVNSVIDRFTNILKNQQGLMFNGTPLSEADREKIVNAIRVAAAIAIPEEGENDESKD
ncbi:helix-turn-helix domain-containing protein [Clostridium merdae]|uniref:helix-turn-helix domain-containing protein n=1 Tax=Clostridium merdae TaxID=1958780 RepID=UPI000A26D08B|nr:helix-turn-helix transcriptional regulator [Clostridium merdae]